MAFITPEQGAVQILTYIQTNASTYSLFYFVSPTTALSYSHDATYTTASFTTATSMSGGATLGSAFGAPVNVSTTLAAMSLTSNITQTYGGSTSQAIYGFFINDNTGKLIWADSLAAITVQNNGDAIILTSLVANLTLS